MSLISSAIQVTPRVFHKRAANYVSLTAHSRSTQNFDTKIYNRRWLAAKTNKPILFY
ncbi:MAG: hypothetical protein Fur006_54650 [Coleofasciculaceae cyanobacterium]